MDRLRKNQRDELLKELRREDVKKYADRIRVILLLDQGWTIRKVSEALFLDPSTIHRYRASYIEGGLERLIHDGYFGKRCLLSPEQQDLLSSHLEQSPPLASKEVIEYVLDEFGVEYSISGVTALLHRLGFSYRKPDPKPSKANPKDQAEFKRRLAIIRSKMKSNDHLYFADAAHPQMNSMPMYGWYRKGERTFLPTNASRTRANLLGLVDLDAQETIIRSFKSINENSTLSMIEILERKHQESSCVTVVTDNASYFKSNAVKERLKKSNVRFIYLPAYSPNLNPIERLWKYLQKNILYNTYHSSPEIFKKSLTNFCRGLRFRWHELESLITYSSQSFA